MQICSNHQTNICQGNVTLRALSYRSEANNLKEAIKLLKSYLRGDKWISKSIKLIFNQLSTMDSQLMLLVKSQLIISRHRASQKHYSFNQEALVTRYTTNSSRVTITSKLKQKSSKVRKLISKLAKLKKTKTIALRIPMSLILHSQTRNLWTVCLAQSTSAKKTIL